MLVPIPPSISDTLQQRNKGPHSVYLLKTLPAPPISLFLLLKQEHLKQKLQFCTHLQKLICCALLSIVQYCFTLLLLLLGRGVGFFCWFCFGLVCFFFWGKKPAEGANGKVLQELLVVWYFWS